MNAPAPPTAEEQITFLRSLQRLLNEGNFTSSYKYALLHAIADLCLVKGDDSGAALQLATSAIAEQFVRLYWPQVEPFPAGQHQQILRQNTARQAAVVNQLAAVRTVHGGSLAELERSRSEWDGLRKKVERVVKKMPLWRLQTVSGEQLDFLYENTGSGGSIRLQPGVAYCFRAFYPMVTDMIEGAWSLFVQRRNHKTLGHVTDLRRFLFGSKRHPLEIYRPLLRDLQKGSCFYCGRGINKGGAVDHFIPWRRYSLDLGHNFVLAHYKCNSSKSDLLAAEEHLARWTKRNHTYSDALIEGFNQRNVLHNWPASRQIARWAYSQVHRAGGQVWMRPKGLRPLSGEWKRILAETS